MVCLFPRNFLGIPRKFVGNAQEILKKFVGIPRNPLEFLGIPRKFLGNKQTIEADHYPPLETTIDITMTSTTAAIT